MMYRKSKINEVRENRTINVWSLVIGWVLALLALVALMLVVVNIKSDKEKDSYTLIYNKQHYYVVPCDLIKRDKEYKAILDKYNVSVDIQKEKLGNCVSKYRDNCLYKIKKLETKDILILKDYNGDFVYAFSEKLVK